MENYINLIIAVISGLAAAVPLVLKLIEYVHKAVKEKNWGILLNILIDYMQEAEKQFASGAERKEWVIAMLEKSAKSINYDMDMQAVGNLIDSLCSMSKAVNCAKEVSK